MSRQVIGIVGLGPVGTILGAYLTKAGVEVYGVDSVAARVAQVRADGLRVAGFATLEEPICGCFETLEELTRVEGLTAIFLCTKTWAIKEVAGRIAELQWSPGMRLVAFMNGIGPEDAIGEYIPKERVCRAVVNYAGNLTPEGVATMNWFHPPNLIGPATDRQGHWSAEMEGILATSGLYTQQVSHAEMKKAAFLKTVLNSALNALCAAHGLTMAHAMRLRHTRGKARVLLREGLTVAATVGYNYGEDALDNCMAYLEGGGEHYPSMWFDLKNRRRTEIDYINGKIVKIGRMFKNVDVDLNMFFTSAIVTQEIRNGSRDENDIPDYLVFD